MKKFYVLFGFLILSQLLQAQDYSNPVAEDEIIVEKPIDLMQSYRNRRSRYGILFSVNYEKFSPGEYVSLIQNKKFDELSGGSSVPLIGAELAFCLHDY